MKLILQFYQRGVIIDAWTIDTKDLKGNPKLINVHLDPMILKRTITCSPKPETV